MEIGAAALASDTFKTIQKRLNGYSPGINLRDHLVENPRTKEDLTAHGVILDGIDFKVRNDNDLIAAIDACKIGGEKAFSSGSSKPYDFKQHWAMSASMLATKGLGYREPYRYFLHERGLQLEQARPPGLMDGIETAPSSSALFGASRTIDLSALHLSIAWTDHGLDGKCAPGCYCNVHIDDTGVAMIDALGNLTITPNLFSHTFNELLIKTILAQPVGLPDWFRDRFNLHVLSPEMNHERLGISFDILKSSTHRLTLTASCGLTQCDDVQWSRLVPDAPSGLFDKDFYTGIPSVLKQLSPTLTYTRSFTFLDGGTSGPTRKSRRRK